MPFDSGERLFVVGGCILFLAWLLTRWCRCDAFLCNEVLGCTGVFVVEGIVFGLVPSDFQFVVDTGERFYHVSVYVETNVSWNYRWRLPQSFDHHKFTNQKVTHCYW